MSTSATPLGKQAYLHGRAVDFATIVGPWLVFGALLLAGVVRLGEPVYAAWIAQFVFGNTTHVILTFLLLVYRRDVLNATRGQAKTVIVGSILVFAATLSVTRVVGTLVPMWAGFPVAVLAIFGTHHRISQAKGIWSLYNLRGSQLGLPPPSSRERALQQHWVSLALVVVMVAWLFIPVAPEHAFPLFQAIPQAPAALPYWVGYGLAAAWGIYSVFLLVEIGRASRVLWPKFFHVLTHTCAVGLALVRPAWGSIVWGSIHGLEYTFLCARMMRARNGDVFRGPESWSGGVFATTGLMAVSMAPLLLVGIARGPFPGLAFGGSVATFGFDIVNALVIAHYFADAFIYRFRIPEVRKVALRRMGFA